jgi:hypothetical protein
MITTMVLRTPTPNKEFIMAMTPKEAIEYLKKAGVPMNADFDDLTDEEVLDAKEAEAEAINEKGLEEKLGYLLYGAPSSEKVLDRLIAEYKFIISGDIEEQIENTGAVA